LEPEGLKKSLGLEGQTLLKGRKKGKTQIKVVDLLFYFLFNSSLIPGR